MRRMSGRYVSFMEESLRLVEEVVDAIVVVYR
jgi:hypothetical protein